MSLKLEKCPYCGSDKISYRNSPFGRNEDSKEHIFQCRNCTAYTDFYPSLVDAFVAWNLGVINENKF